MRRNRTAAYLFLYLGFWLAILAAAIYLASRLERPWWQGALAGYLVFWLGNGTFAYRHRSRRLRAEGKEPEPYLSYLFFGSKGFKAWLGEAIAVPRPLRIVVGLAAVIFGGILLAVGVFFVGELVLHGLPEPRTAGHVLWLMLLCAIPLSLGTIVGYLGYRLIVVRDDEPLMGKRKSPAAAGLG